MGTQGPEMPFFPTVPQTLFPSPQRRHRNSLPSARALSRRRRQRRDLPQHAGKQPPRQMPLGQQQPVVARMLDQPPAGFYQPLLQAGQRPLLTPAGNTKPPAQIAQARRAASQSRVSPRGLRELS